MQSTAKITKRSDFMNNKEIYAAILEQNPVKRSIFKKTLMAFLIGGIIGLIAQALIGLYTELLGIELKISQSLMAMTIVFVTSILTGLGIFDKIGQHAGAGTFIPITGFANSMTSSAIESRSEGVVLGIMTNMFKLAGAIIVAGVVSSFVSGLIIYIVRF